MQTLTRIAGSRLVIDFEAPHGDHYIGVRTDPRPDRCEVAEVVRSGHVVERHPLRPGHEPEALVALLRSEYGRFR